MSQEEHPSRFSVAEYVRGLQNEKSEANVTAGSADLEKGEAFRELAEMIRAELVDSKGKSEEEKTAHTELLNRAVLGYPAARQHILHMIEELLLSKRMFLQKNLLGTSDYKRTAEDLFAELVGMNVLEAVLKRREGLEEIQVVGTKIYEVRNGYAHRSEYTFQRIEEVERIQQNLVLFNNDRFSPRKRWAEVSFVDGSRVTLTGYGYTREPTITIRFYPLQHFSLSSLADERYGTLDQKMLTLMKALIRSYFNFIIIGATNSGKTHLMKAMIREMKDDERIVTIESRSELMLSRDFPHKNIVEYEVEEDDPEHDSKRAFKLALRQSPKRIIHAEIRDEDANTYVRACTRGHDGSMTTVHANTLEDVPDVITDMCMLDRRGMDPNRLRKRVAAYVAQIGVEMGIVGHQRKVLRMVEYECVSEHIHVRELAYFSYEEGIWKQNESLSAAAIQRIAKHHPDSIERLRALGWCE
ncbi:ATPase, T2SS/T4P/T4SS family [Marinicrinis lubricantis]|uniref:ATPase, T2SS/T4P/T4SS family n=1 Tax=Marinicrinis lubricantis TaxID=2086470 RepID=A0ABW1IJG9_9BACL